MTTRQPLRHLTLKHLALIKERLGHVAASHPKQFFILPGFFAEHKFDVNYALSGSDVKQGLKSYAFLIRRRH